MGSAHIAKPAHLLTTLALRYDTNSWDYPSDPNVVDWKCVGCKCDMTVLSPSSHSYPRGNALPNTTKLVRNRHL